MRLFVAITIPEDVRGEIGVIEEKLRSFYSAKWVEPENIHLTLKFLGEVEEERLSDVRRIIGNISVGLNGFDLSLSGVGGFPNLTFPRVLWVGVDKGRENAKRIMEQMEKEFTIFGIRSEKREKHPHITIGRIRASVALAAPKSIGEITYRSRIFEVGDLALIRSILTKKGADYTVVERFEL